MVGAEVGSGRAQGGGDVQVFMLGAVERHLLSSRANLPFVVSAGCPSSSNLPFALPLHPRQVTTTKADI